MRFMIGFEIIVTLIEIVDFILKVAYAESLYWYNESQLLIYHFSYIFVFNTISITLMICVYCKYLKMKKDEELDSNELHEVRDHREYVKVYWL